VTAEKSLLRKASPLIVGRAITAVLGSAIPIFLARALDPEGYGTYKQFFLIATTLYLAGQLGLGASLYYFVPRSRAEAGRYVIQALACLFVLGALAALFILAIGDQVAHRFDNPALGEVIVPLALYTWGVLGAAPLEISLTATGRTGWSGVTYVISDVLRSTVLLGPVALGWGLPGLAWAAAAFAGLRLLAAWVSGIALHGGEASWPTPQAVKAQLAYSIPFGGAVLLSVAQVQLPQYAVASLTGAVSFAIYSVGALQLPLTDLLYGPVAEVMMVRLAQAAPGGEPAIFREAVGRLTIFFLPLLAFVWAVGGELIVTLYTHQYAAAAPIFLVAAGEIGLAALPVDGLLRSLGATRLLFVTYGARVILSAASVLVGLRLFGLPGAMAGHIFTQAVAKGYLLHAAARRLEVPARELLPVKEIAAWAARSAVVFLAVFLLRELGPWHGWAFFAAAFPLAGTVWLISLLSAGELRVLRSFRKVSETKMKGAQLA
jgi:O-antigen/teichoic acid export membrane protein